MTSAIQGRAAPEFAALEGKHRAAGNAEKPGGSPDGPNRSSDIFSADLTSLTDAAKTADTPAAENPSRFGSGKTSRGGEGRIAFDFGPELEEISALVPAGNPPVQAAPKPPAQAEFDTDTAESVADNVAEIRRIAHPQADVPDSGSRIEPDKFAAAGVNPAKELPVKIEAVKAGPNGAGQDFVPEIARLQHPGPIASESSRAGDLPTFSGLELGAGAGVSALAGIRRLSAPQGYGLAESARPLAQVPDISRQIFAALVVADGKSLEIRLDPPELGRVQLTFNLTDNSVQAIIQTERSDIGDLLRKHADHLVRDLAEQGFAKVNLEIRTDLPDSGNGPGRFLAPVAIADDAVSEMADDLPEVVRGFTRIGPGLDIRF